MSTIDFNTAMQRAKTVSFDPLPDGPYDVVCIESEAVTTSTGKPMIKAKWQVENGPQSGRKVYDQYVFSADNDNALSFFFQHMRFFGLDEAFFSQIGSMEQVATALPGRRCRLQLGTRMWEGQPRNEVKKIMPPTTPNAAAPAGGAVAGIAPAVAGIAPVAAAPQPQVPTQQPIQQPVVQQPVPQDQPVYQPPVQQPVVQGVPQPQMPQMPQMPQVPAQQPVAPQPQVQQPVMQPVPEMTVPGYNDQPAVQQQPVQQQPVQPVQPAQPADPAQPVQQPAPDAWPTAEEPF